MSRETSPLQQLRMAFKPELPRVFQQHGACVADDGVDAVSFLNDQAGVFAAYLQKELGDDARKKISTALNLVFCREPVKAEVDQCVKLINDFQAEDKLSAEQAFKYFCLLALNLNEFVYLD